MAGGPVRVTQVTERQGRHYEQGCPGGGEEPPLQSEEVEMNPLLQSEG